MKIDSIENLDKFRDSFGKNCTEEGFYSNSLKKMIQITPSLYLSLLILGFIVYNKYEGLSRLILVAPILFIIFYVLILIGLSHKEFKRLGIGKPEKWYKLNNDRLRSKINANFNVLLENNNIRMNDHSQIDTIIELINLTPRKGKLKELIKIAFPSFIIIKIWDNLYDNSHDIVIFILLSIVFFFVTLLLSVLFNKINLSYKDDIDKSLILKLTLIKSKHNNK